MIRISGPQSLLISRKLISKLPEKPESHRAYFSKLRTADSIEVDEVLALYFAQGRSFTGEETVEIHTHGNPIIIQSVLNALITAGAIMAERGEFTFRAFMNGKVDLVQAESVLALIESKSKQAASIALAQLGGSLSTVLHQIEDKLTWVLANIEAGIDFSTENIDVIDLVEVKKRILSAKEQVDSLTRSYNNGRLLKDGIRVSIVGSPNVGKSSLLNALLGEEKAIVTDIAGTTRDIVEGSLLLSGMSIHLQDTAGIRNTTDKVEIIGISKSLQSIQSADIVLYMIDLSVAPHTEFYEAFLELPLAKLIFIGSKADIKSSYWSQGLYSGIELFLNSQSGANKASQLLYNEFNQVRAELPNRFLETSSSTEQGLSNLITALETWSSCHYSDDNAVISQARHFEMLVAASAAINSTLSLIAAGASSEFIGFELQIALLSVHQLLGTKFDDQIMDRVFKEFCIGK